MNFFTRFKERFNKIAPAKPSLTPPSSQPKGEGKIVQQTEQFVLVQSEDPTRVYLMMLREELVARVARESNEAFDDAAKLTATQLYAVSQGGASRDQIVRTSAELFKRCFVMRFPAASAALSVSKLPSTWEVPVVVVGWPR